MAALIRWAWLLWRFGFDRLRSPHHDCAGLEESRNSRYDAEAGTVGLYMSSEDKARQVTTRVVAATRFPTIRTVTLNRGYIRSSATSTIGSSLCSRRQMSKRWQSRAFRWWLERRSSRNRPSTSALSGPRPSSRCNCPAPLRISAGLRC